MSPSLLSLPNELLVRILDETCWLDLVSCREVRIIMNHTCPQRPDTKDIDVQYTQTPRRQHILVSIHHRMRPSLRRSKTFPPVQRSPLLDTASELETRIGRSQQGRELRHPVCRPFLGDHRKSEHHGTGSTQPQGALNDTAVFAEQGNSFQAMAPRKYECSLTLV